MNRALAYARRTGALEGRPDALALQRDLELWYLRTRFAYRVPLEQVVAALLRCPPGEVHWRGGPQGDWHEGPPPTP